MPPKPPSHSSLHRSLFSVGSSPSLPSLQPLPATDFFDIVSDVTTPRGVFRLYKTEPIHDSIALCVHGASFTALSFAPLAKRLKSKCTIVAPDLRHHGETQVSGPLSTDNLVQDLLSILQQIADDNSSFSKLKLFLVGHSLGAALVCHLSTASLPSVFDPKGIVCIDVAENTAIDNLSFMKQYLIERPSSFPNLKTAFKWAKSSGTILNTEAIRVHIPSMLKQTESGWVWRVSADLLIENEDHWRSWFEGSFDKFIAFPGGRMLVLANLDRLDKEGIIMQMAGKFQVEVVRNTGHSVHEDDPESVSRLFSIFVDRFSKDLPFVNKI
ncbi:hypothetical protein GEMRC1_009089 [Eukaryota sp. GEM-RC1]